MAKTTKTRLLQLATMAALTSFAVTGCSSISASDPAPRSSETDQEAKSAANESTAAEYANEFLGALASEDVTNYEDLKPPFEINDEQASQLLEDGRADGLSEDQVNEFVNFLYENYHLGEYLYFDESAPNSHKIQAITLLTFVQSYVSEVQGEVSNITEKDVLLENKNGEIYATISDPDSVSLTPTLIFVDSGWMIDGESLLNELLNTGASLEQPQ